MATACDGGSNSLEPFFVEMLLNLCVAKPATRKVGVAAERWPKNGSSLSSSSAVGFTVLRFVGSSTKRLNPPFQAFTRMAPSPRVKK